MPKQQALPLPPPPATEAGIPAQQERPAAAEQTECLRLLPCLGFPRSAAAPQQWRRLDLGAPRSSLRSPPSLFWVFFLRIHLAWLRGRRALSRASPRELPGAVVWGHLHALGGFRELRAKRCALRCLPRAARPIKVAASAPV
jgi:hypothetical protein